MLSMCYSFRCVELLFGDLVFDFLHGLTALLFLVIALFDSPHEGLSCHSPPLYTISFVKKPSFVVNLYMIRVVACHPPSNYLAPVVSHECRGRVSLLIAREWIRSTDTSDPFYRIASSFDASLA